MKKKVLSRIAAALERMAPAPLAAPDFDHADAFVWHVEPDRLESVAEVNRVDLALLIGINRARDTLLENTLQFARGLPANTALLWGWVNLRWSRRFMPKFGVRICSLRSSRSSAKTCPRSGGC